MTADEYDSFGGIPGPSFEISPIDVAKVVDRNEKAFSKLYHGDLRISDRRKEILNRAGLTPTMPYRTMAQKTGGISPEDLIAETEALCPGSTSSS